MKWSNRMCVLDDQNLCNRVSLYSVLDVAKCFTLHQYGVMGKILLSNSMQCMHMCVENFLRWMGIIYRQSSPHSRSPLWHYFDRLRELALLYAGKLPNQTSSVPRQTWTGEHLVRMWRSLTIDGGHPGLYLWVLPDVWAVPTVNEVLHST